MGTRASPEETGERKRPRRIESPTATSSQPEAQPQKACHHNKAHDYGAQTTADADLEKSPGDPCGREPQPSVHCAPTALDPIHHGNEWTSAPASAQEIPSVAPIDHDAGRLGRWTQGVLPGQWTQPQRMDDDPGPGMDETSGSLCPRLSVECRRTTQRPAKGGQRPKEATLEPTGIEDQKTRKRSGNHASRIGMVRVFSEPSPDAEDRLRRIFSLVVTYATRDRQDALHGGSPESVRLQEGN